MANWEKGPKKNWHNRLLVNKDKNFIQNQISKINQRFELDEQFAQHLLKFLPIEVNFKNV